MVQSSNSEEGDEIRIRISPVFEENIRKLCEASMVGSIQTLRKLIEDDKDMVQSVLIFCSNDIEYPLHLNYNSPDELAPMVNALQQTPLHLASQNGDMEMVRVLLAKNTSTCLVRDFNGLIPLHHAVIGGHVEMVKELILARPRSMWTKLKNGQTVLHLCVEDNHLEVMKLLIEIFYLYHDEDFLDITDDNGNTILDMSLGLKRFEMLEYLLTIQKMQRGKMSLKDVLAVPKVNKRSKKRNIQISKRREESSKKKKRKGQWQIWKKNLKYKGDWQKEVQGTLMLVATVIATVTFQGAINPPGGTWQQDQEFTSCRWKQEGPAHMEIQDVGTAIMACKSVQIYTIAMTIAVVFLTFAYITGTAMVCGNKTAQSYLLDLLHVWCHNAAPFGSYYLFGVILQHNETGAASGF
ncbi:ankyrin repeat-containing protein [Cucumis melo var. makuwa]|uniref:Ankyrin repeat-containing protein n=1 Tax=Cucumis melo var. makuwa TaxID=1194695 RepID=A0A5A7UTG8_CUCMM|nr:ankyrin repeat-containing protein [Cucumis melo var. makuwa]